MKTQTSPSQMTEINNKRSWVRPAIVVFVLFSIIGFLVYRIQLAFPIKAPNLDNTLTPLTQLAPDGIGSYDVLGYVVSKEEADRLLQTEAGAAQLAPENGAVKITQDLIDLGRKAFYTETFGNEYFFTDVLGVIDGPIDIANMGKAIINTGLLQAFATNSAAMFRQTGINPTTIPPGERTYINASGQKAQLPDAKALEDALDAQLLAWAPGNFDSRDYPAARARFSLCG